MDLKELIIKKLGGYGKKARLSELLADLAPDFQPDEIRLALRELASEGKVIFSKKEWICLSGRFGHFTGRLDVKRLGYAFLPDGEGDIFISPDNKMGAMNGDLVAVRLLSKPQNGRKREGEVTQILEAGHKRIVGTFSNGFVIPDDDRLEDIYIPGKAAGGAADGQKVVAEIEKRARGDKSAQGRIVEVIGAAGVSCVEIESCIKRFELPGEFPRQAVEEARRVSEEKISPQGREDFRDLNIFTIDGENAKDFDDAVSIKKLGRGYELGVHIADVSHYVREGGALDREALRRGTSVYLADRVIPMLPETLSNGACSLSEGNDRLTLSCLMDIDESGRITRHRIVKSIIRSKHRMTYTDVNAIFGGDKNLINKYTDIYGDLSEMRALAELLRKRREEKGSIDFEIEETAFSFDESGNVTGVGPRERGEAERLIEEFMLAANMTVAEEYYWRGVPFVYRVHEQPDEEKIRTFAAFYSNFGKIRGKIDNIHPKTLQSILKDIKGTAHQNIVNQIMLRSLKKAEYSSQCKGHFGLSFRYYCHFTSPIRRYPDLEVHRIIKMDKKGALTPKYLEALEGKVEEIAKQSSVRERVAMEAERAVDDIKKAEFMLGREGEEYDGVVSGVLKNVIFVQLDNTVEGVIPLSSLQDDYYVFNEKLYCITGERTRRKIALGDEMRVRVASVNAYPPRIEFEPA